MTSMTTNQSREIVSVLDPAIDHQRTDIRAYIDDRDPARLVYKDGQEPTRYYVRHIGTRLFNTVVESAPTDASKWALAFKHGIVEVHNLDGRARYVPEGSNATGVGPHLTDEQLEDFAPAVIHEVGQIVYQSAFLGRGSTVSYRLLPSLLSHLTAQVVRDAESLRTELSSRTSGDSSHPDGSESESGA